MEVEKLNSAIVNFSAKFCNELQINKSLVSSPLSAELVLALLTLGTSGTAHDELLKALELPNDDFIRSSFNGVSAKLKSVKGVTFNIANKIYVKDGGYELTKQLHTDAVEVFKAEIEKLNCDNGPAAAELINQWVESQTSNRIKNLLSPSSINSDTRLVLVNALYFKGSWKHKFDTANTSERPFHLDNKNTVNVPMMYMEKNFLFGDSQELNAKLLQMPYEGEEASMIIILPNEIEGLGEVMKQLANGFDLNATIKSMFSTKVQVTVPKFKIETEIDLKILLPKLGIKQIFDPNNTGLTGILSNNERLYVSKAVQKAFIEVNEEGAEAAAATAFGIMAMCAMIEPDPLQFVADHPFLSVIIVNNTIAFWANYNGDTNKL